MIETLVGAIVGGIIGAASTLIAMIIDRKHQKKEAKRKYYDSLLSSLPSYDIIKAQADYLDDNDALLGGFTDAEARLKVLTDRMNQSERTDEERMLYKHKIKEHKQYLEYWEAANKKIKEFMGEGYFNSVKAVCTPEVIDAYYRFVNDFHNEHDYCGPVINTEQLQNRLVSLVVMINKELN